MQINLLGFQTTGRSLAATAQSRKNFYLDIQLDGGDKSRVAAYPLPGLASWDSAGISTRIRALHWWSYAEWMVVIAAATGTTTATLYLLVETGAQDSSALGAPVTITTDRIIANSSIFCVTDNGPDLLITSDTIDDAYTVSISGLVGGGPGTLIPVATALSTATNYSCFIGQRFVIPWLGYSGRFAWSDMLDTTFDALNFATAESMPDSLVRVFAWRGVLVLFGETSIEFWQSTGDLAAPFQAIAGTASNYGLADMRSVQIVGDSLIFLARAPGGARTVCKLDGYQPVRVAPPDLEYKLNLSTEYSVASSSAFTASGHDFYLLTFSDASYVYDAASGIWSTWASPGSSVCQIDCVAPFTTSSGTVARTVAGTASGKIHRIDAGTYTEPVSGVATALTREIVLPHLFDADDYNKMIVSRLRLDAEGEDTATNVPPTIDLYISRDGGRTYGAVQTRTFAGTADGTLRAEWRRLGMARDWVFKLSTAIAKKTVLLNAWIEAEKANK